MDNSYIEEKFIYCTYCGDHKYLNTVKKPSPCPKCNKDEYYAKLLTNKTEQLIDQAIQEGAFIKDGDDILKIVDEYNDEWSDDTVAIWKIASDESKND